MSRKPNRLSHDLVCSAKALSSAMTELKQATELRNQLETKAERSDFSDDAKAKQQLLVLNYERILLMQEIKLLRAKIAQS